MRGFQQRFGPRARIDRDQPRDWARRAGPSGQIVAEEVEFGTRRDVADVMDRSDETSDVGIGISRCDAFVEVICTGLGLE
jgi:hypothetical protein